jgi:hypothetical protein
MPATVDLNELKARTDVRHLASRYVTLHKHTRAELEGPCPACGGHTRCFYGDTYWHCRECGAGGSAIDYVMHHERCSFQEAIAMLATDAPTAAVIAPAQPRTQRPAAQSDAWRTRCTPLMDAYTAALLDGDNPGAVYLADRGFSPDTWRTFGLGYDAERNAIALPWLRQGQLSGIRYRLIAPADPKRKLISEPESVFSGLLFGGQALPLPPDSRMLAHRYLFIVEGEFNAMSIYQVGMPARVDVLSLGSESAALPDFLPTFASRYRTCIVWMDRPEVARRNAKALGAAAYWSETDGRKVDANDMLRAGTLGTLIAALLTKATAPEHAEALHWDLYDANVALPG